MTIIPIYNTIILPNARVYFKKDLLASKGIEEMKEDEEVVFLILKEKQEGEVENVTEDFYPIGVAGIVKDVDNEGTVGIELTHRIDIEDVDLANQTITAAIRQETLDFPEEEAKNQMARLRTVMLKFVKRYQWGLMARGYILQWKTIDEMAVGLSPFLNMSEGDKYEILKEDSAKKRAELIESAVMEFMTISEVSEEAETATKEKNEKVYREDAIKKQINFLQKQLDEMHPENVTDARRFEEKLQNLGMNEAAKKEADKVLNRLKQEGPDGHEYGMLYDYLDFVTGLEWKKHEQGDIDIEEAEKILDREHFGLAKVKKRIIEQLAVMALNKKQSGSILLFTGAPGTGKTSIGKSIAEALNREYVRISLGGVRDEAEIRGHRRTYIGAMPGRIMDGMRKCQTSNPVVVLDEIDKLAKDYSGDPASALLEVLDPEQNNTFTDHYMNVPYDLSDVLFICTANTLDSIPAPLLDRMEMIQFPGYTAIEKFNIAKKHLVPKAKEKMGIKTSQLNITDDALKKLIEGYTMESGVRGLKKTIDKICRYAAVEMVKNTSQDKQKKMSITAKQLSKILDMRPIHHETVLEKKEPGVVTGLAWTQAGGEILFIETAITKGTGKLLITGQLGDVMKESAQIALSLVKKIYPDKADIFKKNDIHIHVPAGAVPKDGPSAGITLTTALSSLVTNNAISPEYAMTGEVSLRGTVMPIGGLPEKLMAAERAGIKKVLIPYENVDDLKDVAEEVLQKLTIIPVKRVKDVLKEVDICK